MAWGCWEYLRWSSECARSRGRSWLWSQSISGVDTCAGSSECARRNRPPLVASVAVINRSNTLLGGQSIDGVVAGNTCARSSEGAITWPRFALVAVDQTAWVAGNTCAGSSECAVKAAAFRRLSRSRGLGGCSSAVVSFAIRGTMRAARARWLGCRRVRIGANCKAHDPLVRDPYRGQSSRRERHGEVSRFAARNVESNRE
jgi:hypothetical protein